MKITLSNCTRCLWWSWQAISRVFTARCYA